MSIRLSIVISAILIAGGAPVARVCIAAENGEAATPSQEEVLRRLIDAAFAARDYPKAHRYFGQLAEQVETLSPADRLRWAKAAELSKKPDEALEILDPLLTAKRRPVKALVEAAQLSVQVKAFSAAAEHYGALAQRQPDSAQWPLMRAKTLVWAEKHGEAATVLAGLYKKAPKDREILGLYAEALYHAGSYAKAAGLYGELLAAIPAAEKAKRPGVLRNAAAAAMGAKDYAGARRYFGRLSDAVKTLAPAERLQWAKAAELSKKPDEALKILQPLLKAKKPPVKALVEAAQLSVRVKAFAAAAERYAALSKRQPDNEQWPLMRAKTLMWAEKHGEAATVLAGLHKKKPKNREILGLYAEALYHAGSYAKAVGLYGKLLATMPAAEKAKRPEILRNAAAAAMGAKKYLDAYRYFEQLAGAVEKLSPADRLRWAKAAELAGKPKEALKILQPLLKTDTPSAKVLTEAAQLAVQAKSFATAAECYAALSQRQPDNERWPLMHAKTLMWAEQYGEAATVLAGLHERTPDNREILGLYADALYFSGRFETPIPLYEKLLQAAPDRHGVRLKLARCCMAAGRYEKAAAHFRPVYESDTSASGIGGELAKALYLAGDLDEASALLETLIAREPDSVPLLGTAADVAAERQQYDKAIRLYRRAIAAGDNRRETRVRLARVLSWNRDYDEAFAVYDRLIAERPDDWKIRREKARALGWDRQYAASLATYGRILDRDPDNLVVRKEFLAKDAFYKRHDAVAITRYQSLLEEEPDNLEARFELGQACSRRSMWPEARESYRDVLEIFPGHDEAREALDEVELLSTAIEINPFFNYQSRDSGSRSVNVEKYAFGTGARQWIADRVRLSGEYSREQLAFTGRDDRGANVFTLGLDYVPGPRWRIVGRAGARNYPGGEDEFLYDVDVSVATLPGLEAGLYSRRREHLENVVTFENRLYRIDNGTLLRYRPHDNFRVMAGYERACLTDNNGLGTLFGDVQVKILREPRRLTVGYRVEHLAFDDNSPFYFSPQDFLMHSVRIDWRHYLNEKELHWGSRRTYYELGYRFGWDSRDQNGHTWRAGLYHEFSRRVRLNLTGSMTRGTVYDADQVMLSLSLFAGGAE